MPRIKIDLNDVIRLLHDLNPHKTAGPDSMPTHILKTAAEKIALILSKIFQTSLVIEKIADWREAHIVPLFKKADKHLASNYRPVSFLSIIFKFREHLVHSNIINHFLENNILCDN